MIGRENWMNEWNWTGVGSAWVAYIFYTTTQRSDTFLLGKVGEVKRTQCSRFSAFYTLTLYKVCGSASEIYKYHLQYWNVQVKPVNVFEQQFQAVSLCHVSTSATGHEKTGNRWRRWCQWSGMLLQHWDLLADKSQTEWASEQVTVHWSVLIDCLTSGHWKTQWLCVVDVFTQLNQHHS